MKLKINSLKTGTISSSTMLPWLFLLLFNFHSLNIFSQGYTNWITGDTSDFISTTYSAGIVLAGGGGDNDDAMKWMLQRAGGGDVVVIRASGSDGYNDYFYSELGINVNSVETIHFDDASASSDPYVLQQIENAEVLFIAGGNQYDYYQYWKDNAVEEIINSLINEKQITVGGTSAGMAILGNAYYTPPGSSAQTDQVLANPYDASIDILGSNDFINNPYLPLVITDTHFDQRERAGRLVVFMARLAHESNERIFAIACNEYTTACMDENGHARVFGEFPEFEDYAYFLETNCQNDFLPEILENGQPLTWDRNNAAVKAYRIPGTISGDNQFDTQEWMPINGGQWFDWHVENGVLFKNENAGAGCGLISHSNEIEKEINIEINPTLVSNSFFIKNNSFIKTPYTISIFNPLGQSVFNKKTIEQQEEINISAFSSGIYFVNIFNGKDSFTKKIFKK